LAEQCRRACRSSSVALLVDADHGYGNALNVMRTVEELENAGVAGLTIEDSVLPRAFGVGGAGQCTTIEEGVAKIKAALGARRERGLAIVGRTNAAQVTGLDDAIARLRAYERAGADALMVPRLKNLHELKRVAAATVLPLITGGEGVTASAADLAEMRVRVFSGGHQPFAASVKAIHDTMSAIAVGTPTDKLPNVADKAMMNDVTRVAEYTALTREYLGG